MNHLYTNINWAVLEPVNMRVYLELLLGGFIILAQIAGAVMLGYGMYLALRNGLSQLLTRITRKARRGVARASRQDDPSAA